MKSKNFKQKRSILLIFFIVSTTFSYSQIVGETYLGLSVNNTKYDDWFHTDELSENSLLLEINRTWAKNNEEPFNLVAELGAGIKQNSLSRGSGGMGGGGTYTGNYWQLISGGALLGQIRISTQTSLQIGPRVESLIVGYEKTTYEWWGIVYSEGVPRGTNGTTKVSEFNRNYFDNVYYGLNLKVLTQQTSESKKLGINICYLFTEKSDSNFNSKYLFRFGLVIQI